MSTGSENEMENAAIVLETIRAVEERDAAKLFNLYHEDV
jgi:ketosteroid isomerase-like protein